MRRHRLLAGGLVASAALVLAATALSADRGQHAKKLTVAVVTDTPLHDQGYNQYSYLGIKRGAAKVGAKMVAIESSSPNDYQNNLTTAAQEADFVLASEFTMADALQRIAEQNPSKKFAILDYSYPKPQKNIQADVFAANESSYLGGIVAAGISKSHVIGFVGGVDSPVLEEFLAGFEAGALAQDPKVHVKVAWTGSFSDQQKGKEAAAAEIAQKADVIYEAAGSSGLGVFTAAKQAHIWAIGVDQDQNHLAPKTIVTSVIKHVDVAAYDNVVAVQKGTWKPGVKVFDLKNHGVGLAPYHGLAKVVPAKVKRAVKRATKAIVSGKVHVPEKPKFPHGL